MKKNKTINSIPKYAILLLIALVIGFIIRLGILTNNILIIIISFLMLMIMILAIVVGEIL